MSPRLLGPTKPLRDEAQREKKRSYLLRDVPPQLWYRARRHALDTDTTLRALLLAALAEHLDRADQGQGRRGRT